MFISDERYSNWQKQLTERIFFRRFWVFFGIYTVPVFFILGLYLLFVGQWKIVIAALAAFILARLIISPLIFLFYKRQRPYQKLKFTSYHSRLFSAATLRFTSFPSDHAISFASISGVCVYYHPHWGIVLIPLTLLNGIGRVVLGYHYVSDIIAGWLLGALSAFAIIYWLCPRLFTH
jgi:undecaprenyl-diphosphatase